MTPLPWDLLDRPAVVVRPHVPDLHRARRLLDQRRGFHRRALVVSRGDGPATWFDDRRPQRRVDLRTGNGPGELAEPWWALLTSTAITAVLFGLLALLVIPTGWPA